MSLWRCGCFVLQANYRKPIDFTKDAMESATNGWHTLGEGLQFGFKHGEALNWTEKTQHTMIKSVQERFLSRGGSRF